MTKIHLQDDFKNYVTENKIKGMPVNKLAHVTIDSTNPKDLLGIKKENISLIPPEGIKGIAKAMKFGADKYGAYNWRSKQVQYKIYLDAIMRHTLALVEGQDNDPDSGLSHLDHIGANVVILKDAIKYNCLVDNRDIPKPTFRKENDDFITKDAIFKDFNKKFGNDKTEIKPLDLERLFRSGNEQHNTNYGERNEEI